MANLLVGRDPKYHQQKVPKAPKIISVKDYNKENSKRSSNLPVAPTMHLAHQLFCRYCTLWPICEAAQSPTLQASMMPF